MSRFVRRLFVFVGVAVVACVAFVASTSKAAPAAPKPIWQYRQVECPPSAVQATLEDLGRDGWEVFNVYGASTLNNEGGGLKQVPHTFYVFAKKPSQ